MDGVIHAETDVEDGEGHGDQIQVTHCGSGERSGPDEAHNKGYQAGEHQPGRAKSKEKHDANHDER